MPVVAGKQVAMKTDKIAEKNHKSSEKEKLNFFREVSRYDDDYFAYECLENKGYSILEYKEWKHFKQMKTEQINEFVVKLINAGYSALEEIEGFRILFKDDADALEALDNLSVVFFQLSSKIGISL